MNPQDRDRDWDGIGSAIGVECPKSPGANAYGVSRCLSPWTPAKCQRNLIKSIETLLISCAYIGKNMGVGVGLPPRECHVHGSAQTPGSKWKLYNGLGPLVTIDVTFLDRQ